MARFALRYLRGLAALVVALLVLGGVLAVVACRRFDESMGREYAVPVPPLVARSDAALLARGKHLAESVGGCTGSFCHGVDLAGGQPVAMGPIGTLVGPNITPAGSVARYSDGELARLIQHGIKKDGRTVLFMPSQAFGWLPDGDVEAIVSYLRTVPAIERADSASVVSSLGKVLDRIDALPLDVARRVDQSRRERVPPVEPTVAYGAFLVRLCTGCHGEHLSGGRVPGAPPELPTPLNLTPDATGLKDWAFNDFETLMRTGRRKSGATLDPFMSVEEWRNLDDVEMRALWAYLRETPAHPFGER